MENYSLLIMGEGDGDEDGSGVDEDGSGAIPRPGRVPERSFCPPNLDFGAVAARNFSGSLINIFRV